MQTAKLIFWVLLCQLPAWAGMGAVSANMDWYHALLRPSFTPPDWMFGAAWSVLYLLLGAGIACVSLGVTFFFRTYLPMEVYELFVAETAKRFDLRTEKMKLYYDLSQLAITLTLAFTLFDPSDFDWRGIYATAYHSLGPGTVLATFLNAPLIALFGKAADRLFGYGALFPGLKKHLAVPYAKKTSSEKEGGGSDCA